MLGTAEAQRPPLDCGRNSRLNLATFEGAWMEPEASQLYAAAFDKNCPPPVGEAGSY
ncbi:hypothetical protein [Arthrobacter sp. 162MFSha1.1]|uniref:hypothetical protein n=1 Tax=Arthrobacter sp. 162MFSha1.1 TaxID=1151119 RepID=UPI0003782EF8|nr:hypothetical protein [Arthrobacter sp. 162MFSha1.1]